MISYRYAVPLLLLTLVALPSAIRHHYATSAVDDGVRAEMAPGLVAGLAALPSFERPAWVAEAFASSDWTVRRYLDAERREISVYVVRSYDTKRLYHHPELALIHGRDVRPAGIAHHTSAPAVPLHVLRGDHDGLVVYTLVYDGTAIESPYAFQAKLAARLLLESRKPMTLIFGEDFDAERGIAIEKSAATSAVLETTRLFLSLTHPR